LRSIRLEWNECLFDIYGAEVIIVSDVPRPPTPGVRFVEYPTPMPVYSPAQASNYGIRQAGAGIVCKTDIDCVFTRQAMDKIAEVVGGRGVAFRYMMADDIDSLDTARAWSSGIGTMALHSSDWGLICGYDERMTGYGLEDGDGFCRAVQAGIDVPDVRGELYHIAHTPGTPQIVGRYDQWGRDDGFCPLHAAKNAAARRAEKWCDPCWGLGKA